MSEFRLGTPYVAETCCGKPQGCTNISEGCTMRRHPAKRPVIEAAEKPRRGPARGGTRRVIS